MRLLRRSMAVVLLLIGGTAVAQRHSGDAEQGYFRKPADPILNIEDGATKQWTYLRLSALKRLKQTAISVPAKEGKPAVSFTGVLLTDLPAAIHMRSFEIFRDGLLRDRLALQSGELDPSAEVLVAYRRDGRDLGLNPFVIVARDKQGQIIVLSEPAYIKLELMPTAN